MYRPFESGLGDKTASHTLQKQQHKNHMTMTIFFSIAFRLILLLCTVKKVNLHTSHGGPHGRSLSRFLQHEATESIATPPWMGC